MPLMPSAMALRARSAVPCAEVGVVHAAGGWRRADEGVRAGVVRDAVDGKVLSDGHFRRHDHVVGRGEQASTPAAMSAEAAATTSSLVFAVCSTYSMPLCVKVCLCVRDGLAGVRLIEGVEQANLGDVRVLSEHHIHDELGVERVARAGDIVDAGGAWRSQGRKLRRRPQESSRPRRRARRSARRWWRWERWRPRRRRWPDRQAA